MTWGLGKSDLGLAEWARLAPLGRGCVALRSIHGVEEPVPSAVQGTPGSEPKAGRFRAAPEASNKDPAMRRSLLAIGILRSEVCTLHRMTAQRAPRFAVYFFSALAGSLTEAERRVISASSF